MIGRIYNLFFARHKSSKSPSINLVSTRKLNSSPRVSGADPEYLAKAIGKATSILSQADGCLILAGAGMSADSGIPTYRGNAAFSETNPVYKRLGIPYESIASAKTFRRFPEYLLAYHGSRLDLFREAEPHQGYDVLRDLVAEMPDGYHVYTTNVDGAFEKAGYQSDSITEIHGSMHRWQCIGYLCSTKNGMTAPPELHINPDGEKVASLPRCAFCGGVLRPNVMMFNDNGWDDSEVMKQRSRYYDFVSSMSIPGKRLAVLEIGAGDSIPKLRKLSERFHAQTNCDVIRINPEASMAESESDILTIPLGAKEAIHRISK